MIVNMNVNVVRKSRDMWGLGQNITVIILLAQNIQDNVWQLYGLMLNAVYSTYSSRFLSSPPTFEMLVL